MRLLANLLDPYCGLCESEPVFDNSLCWACLDLFGEAMAAEPIFVPPRKNQKREFSVWSCVHYERDWKKILLRAKRNPSPFRCSFFSQILTQKLQAVCETEQISQNLEYVWIPGKETQAGAKPHLVEGLVAHRKFRRGFSRLGLIPAQIQLRRHKDYRSQHELSKTDRLRSRERFLPTEKTQNSKTNLLIFDDIVTTGATFVDCARTLSPRKVRLAFSLAYTPER